MRYFHFFILFSVAFALGCTRSVDERLMQVNAFADGSNIDSAAVVLQSIAVDSLSEHNRRYYDLMSIKLRDKSYQDIKGDTAITELIRYFDDNGTHSERAEAYYYGGRVYREMGDLPQSLDYFQKALDALDDDNTHARLKGKICSQMGQMFFDLQMYKQAIPKFQMAARYNITFCDSVNLVYNYRELSDIYYKLSKSDSTIFYLDKALKIAKALKDTPKCEIEIRTSIVDYYIKWGYYEKAKTEFNAIEQIIQEKDFPDYLLMTGINIYIIEKNYDKLAEFANRLLQSHFINSKMYAYEIHAELAKFKGNKDDAFDNIMKYKTCLDSIDNNVSREAVIHQNSFYNYSLKEKENTKLKNRQLTITFTAICSILVLIIFVLVVIYINRVIKRINNTLSVENKQLHNTCESLEQEKHILLSEKELMKMNLTQQLNKISLLETNIESIRTSLSEKEITDKINKQILLKIENIDTDKYIPDNEIINSEIYALFKQKSRGEKLNITESHWEELDMLINRVCIDFRNKITYLSENISTADYRICLLVKCKFSVKEIAEITSRIPNAVTNQRKRLYKKLFGVEGSPNDLDRYIISL
ncbi:MAG: tetratricopeptide repeat protein [Muribaculaceae bacterium]|nr:tetratricopeptide repeat protein [Muribaculaceae bacterium]